jgi:creatinine amidohydrolase
MNRKRQIQYLRPEEISSEMAKAPIAYWPLGLIEWHGPHLPMGVDAFNAEAVALRVAELGGGLVMPTAYFGTERERPPEVLDWLGFEGHEWVVGMDFPANSLPSMYAREDIFAIFVRENLRLIAAMGFRLIVAITGHAATNQIETLQRVAAEFNAGAQVKVLVSLPFVANEDGVLEVGHASRIETSVMLALNPQTVRLENLPPLSDPLKNRDWAIVDYPTFRGGPTENRTVSDADDPRRATAEAGQEMMEKAAQQLLEQVKAFI